MKLKIHIEYFDVVDEKTFSSFLPLILLGDVCAQAVHSCDGSYSAKIVGHSEMLIEHTGRKIGVVKIDSIVGGVFDPAGELLIVYGIPNKVNLRSPQAEYLSIYRTRPTPHRLMRKTYGGGVYDVAIGAVSSLIFASSRFGFDIFNIKAINIKSFDPMSEPRFSRQRCENN